jgi:CRP-like cAMP-binding protein
VDNRPTTGLRHQFHRPFTPRFALHAKIAPMQLLLDFAQDRPRRAVAAGEVLVAEGTRPGSLFVLLDGALEVRKAGQIVAVLSEPGACVGEMSLLLDAPASADVVGAAASTVAVLEDADQLLVQDPTVALALARTLAARVQHMTTYLADLQHQYADHEGGLGMVGSVLGTLMHRPGVRSELGSARDPDPEY